MRDTLRYPESITAVTWLEYCRFGLDVKRRPYWGLQPPSTQKTVSLDFDEQMAREGRQRNLKFHKYCRYGVKHYSNNQSFPSLRTFR